MNFTPPPRAKTVLRIVLQALFAVGLVLFFNESELVNLDFLEFYAYDVWVRARPTPPVSGLVHLVAVDGNSIAALKSTPTIREHNLLLKNLLTNPPRALIYTLNPATLKGTKADFQEFADLAEKFPHFFVSTQDIVVKGNESSLQLKYPLNKLKVISGPQTSDEGKFAGDGVTRRIVVDYQGRPLLHTQVASLFTNRWKNLGQIRGIFPFLDSDQVLINFHPAGTYQITPFIDSIRKTELPEKWRNQIVLVGTDTAEDADNFIRSPYSRGIVGMSKIESHANMLDTLILNSAPVRAPPWLNILITILISFFTLHVTLSLRPARGLVILAGTISAYIAIVFLTFATFGYWIGAAQPLLGVFISYYFFIPYRLIMENRRSWEYYQKNKILVQVEELKTNFLSMMSHDLKTPLARIQGMTDVIAKDEHPLSPQQANALISIRNSSEELISFISSILDLGRVDSKEVKLNLASRDINNLLSEVIHKYEFLAKEKDISIIEEYEPLFSVKMDPALMQQVFSNLIENAIKYSGSGKRVLVSTEEVDGKIVVQVADQGVGIPSEDLPNVFMKFYRSKDARTSTIKGSGLGLYLAKYFVELHKGSIMVDSAPGQGTTFTVELPTEQT